MKFLESEMRKVRAIVLMFLAWWMVGCTQNNYYIVTCDEGESEYSQAKEEAVFLHSMEK